MGTASRKPVGNPSQARVKQVPVGGHDDPLKACGRRKDRRRSAPSFEGSLAQARLTRARECKARPGVWEAQGGSFKNKINKYYRCIGFHTSNIHSWRLIGR